MTGDGRMLSALSQGILVLGVGVFLLLTTIGVIPPSFWFALLPYWPVLLIAVGLKFIFERSPAPALTLLSPIAILAAMTYVAMGETERVSHDWMPILVERDADFETLRLSGDLHMARVQIDAEPMTALLQGRASVGDEGRAEMRTYDRDGNARVRLGARRDEKYPLIVFGGLERDRWEMSVPTDLPLTIDLDAAGQAGEWNLADADVRHIEVDGALNDLDITLGVPTRDTRIEFEGAFQQVNLYVPANVRVYSGSDGFANTVSGRSQRPRNDDPAYRLFVDGAFNRVKVRNR